MTEVTATIIKGVVFDLDETLVNSKDSIVAYHRALFKYLGLQFPENHAYWFYTLPAEEVTQRLFPDESYREKAREFRRSFDFRKLFQMVTPKDGVPEILIELKKRGKKLAVVTNRDISICPLLEYLGIIELFDEILPANEVKYNKPDPYSLFLLMDKWNATKDQIIYVGDSEIDVETGKNAGVYTITLGNAFPGVKHIDSLMELIDIIESIEGSSKLEGILR